MKKFLVKINSIKSDLNAKKSSPMSIVQLIGILLERKSYSSLENLNMSVGKGNRGLIKIFVE